MVRRSVTPSRLLLLAVALVAPAVAQERSVMPLIPAANWHLVSTRPLGLEEVRQWGGDPAIEREYGVKTLVYRSYHLGEQTADVLFEEAADPSSAYGLLTFYRTPQMQPPKDVGLALTGPEGALMARGRFFIRVRRPPGSQVSETNLRALLISIGGTRPSIQEAASVPPPLPSQGLVAGSEKYLLGLEAARRVLPKFRSDLIGFPQGAEVQMGSYVIGGARGTVLAITYPTPQMARARFGAMESFLGINQDRGSESIYGRRNGSFVILVMDVASAGAAKKLMDQFQITSNVSWNERAPSRKSFTLQVVELVLANIMLAFIIAGFALGGGVLIFISRRVAMKWFPQWDWADPDRETIIRLNLR